MLSFPTWSSSSSGVRIWAFARGRGDTESSESGDRGVFRKYGDVFNGPVCCLGVWGGPGVAFVDFRDRFCLGIVIESVTEYYLGRFIIIGGGVKVQVADKGKVGGDPCSKIGGRDIEALFYFILHNFRILLGMAFHQYFR